MGLVGCVGELEMGGNTHVGTGTNPNPTRNRMAEKMFEQNVYPSSTSRRAAARLLELPRRSKAPVGNVTSFVAANPGGRVRHDHQLPVGGR